MKEMELDGSESSTEEFLYLLDSAVTYVKEQLKESHEEGLDCTGAIACALVFGPPFDPPSSETEAPGPGPYTIN
jgi:hypothetical protein